MNILSAKHKSISLCHPYSVISPHQFKRIWLFSILSVVEWLWNDSLNQYHLTGINPLPRRKCFLPFVVELDTYLIWSRMFSLRHVDWFCGDVRLVYERRTCVVGWKSSSRFFHSKEMSKSSDLAIGKKSILQTHYNPKIFFKKRHLHEVKNRKQQRDIVTPAYVPMWCFMPL